jgi:acyl carrier protein
MRTLETEIRKFVVENFLFGDGSSLADTDSFLDAGLIDSTGVLELVSFLEARFRIRIEDSELAPINLDSVDRVARFVSGKLQGQDRVHAG